MLQRVTFSLLLIFSTLGTMAQVYGDPVVIEDFGQGIPDGWYTETEAEFAEWEYRGVDTEPDLSVCSRGSCGAQSLPPESESLDNGFLIFDSNYW